MKALICPSLGPAENLAVMEVEAPTAGEGEVLVDVAYAGLNFFDTLLIEGKYQVRPKPPFSLPAPSFPAMWPRWGWEREALRSAAGSWVFSPTERPPSGSPSRWLG